MITYLKCEETKVVPLFWNAPAAWKSLTGKMDLLSIPGDHFVDRDKNRAKLAGSIIMTTASMIHKTKHLVLNVPQLRSHLCERNVQRIKDGMNVSLYLDKGKISLLK